MKGYVRKRGNKWSYTVDIGKDPVSGKRRQKTKSGFDTKKAATKALTELQYELDKGTWIEPHSILLKDFALDWFENHKHQLRSTTAEQYGLKIKKWIIPLLGNYKVQDLKPIHGQTIVKKLLTEMEQTTAYKIFAILKMIMNHAVDMEIIQKNPFVKLRLLKVHKRRVETWNFEQLNHFLKITKKHNDFYYRIFAVTAFTGLRKGEVLGLRKSDVDFHNKSIFIKQSLSETKEEGVQISPLKTPSSYRQVAVDSFIISILKEQIHKNNEMKLKMGPDYRDYDLIFCHPDGMPFRPTSLNRPFNKCIELSGVPKIRFHDLRHTHATLLLELKVNPKIVADRLGHSTVKITLDTYSHASMEIQQNVADLFASKAQKA